jgi:hypothetical protein
MHLDIKSKYLNMWCLQHMTIQKNLKAWWEALPVLLSKLIDSYMDRPVLRPTDTDETPAFRLLHAVVHGQAWVV